MGAARMHAGMQPSAAFTGRRSLAERDARSGTYRQALTRTAHDVCAVQHLPGRRVTTETALQFDEVCNRENERGGKSAAASHRVIGQKVASSRAARRAAR